MNTNTRVADHYILDMEISDKKGREIGALVTIEVEQYGPETGRISARVQPTRDDESYGAYQSPKHFDTFAAAHAHAEAHTAKMAKRYAAKIAAGKL